MDGCLPRRNLRKRQVKAPKLHFLDSGLVCHLLGEARRDRTPRPGFAKYGSRPQVDHQVDLDPRGPIVMQSRLFAPVRGRLEDLGGKPAFSGVRKLGDAPEAADLEVERRLVCGGTLRQSRDDVEVIPWNGVQEMGWGPRAGKQATWAPGC